MDSPKPVDTKGWRIIENVVAAIEESLQTAPGAKVTPNAEIPERISPENTREVDVLVQIPTGGRVMAIGVDVKDEKRPLDSTKIEQLISKGQKLALDRYCVLSTSGFAENAVRYARDQGVELLTLSKLHKSDWWQATEFEILHLRRVIEQVAFVYKGNPSLPPAFLGGIKLAELRIRDTDGNVGDFLLRVEGLLRGAEAQLGHPIKDDGIPFDLAIRNDAGKMLALVSGEDEAPFPELVKVTMHYDRAYGAFPVQQFITPKGVEVFVATFEVNGKPLQVSAVSVPNATGRQISVSFQDAKPKRTDMRGKMDGV
jgi:hypothetical protein